MAKKHKTKMKVFLVGEGKSEVGSRSPGQKPKKENLQNAALPHLLARHINGPAWNKNTPFPFQIIDTAQWTDLKVQGKKQNRFADAIGKKPFHEKATRALVWASELKAEVLVVLLDEERHDGFNPREEFMRQVKNYEKKESLTFKIVIGVPSRCLETWLLVDKKARETVLIKGSQNPFPGGGKHSAEERPPAGKLKDYLKEHLPKGMDMPQARSSLAANATPSTLRRICPSSYRPFSDSVKSCF